MSMKLSLEYADFEPREPRCRICREEALRDHVNELLEWHGIPLFQKGAKTHRVTYADIIRNLEPLNKTRAKKDRITYDCLWVHAKRHYDVVGTAAHFKAQVDKMLKAAFGSSKVAPK